MAIKVGDDVLYVPDVCYALIANTEDKPELGIFKGEYPWVIGREKRDGEVEEMPANEVSFHRAKIKSQKATLARHGIKAIRPKVCWPAKVRAVEDDGWLQLDIDQPFSGLTLHARVKVDPAKVPNTCHEPPAKAEDAVSIPPPARVKPARTVPGTSATPQE